MAKMHFKYATMNSGKSIDLMRSAHNYEENGFKVLVIKPLIDTKAGNKISSRVGLEREVDFLLSKNDFVYDKLCGKISGIACIFVDEAQFLEPFQVDELYNISKACDIPVICYGLRNNYRCEAFNGSKRLLELCDELEEIPTLCKCGNIARYVGRMEGNKFVTEGNEIVIDGSTKAVYVPFCGKCYLEFVKKVDLKDIRRKLKYDNRN